MSEMTLEQACEILNRGRHAGRSDWKPRGGDAVSFGLGLTAYSIRLGSAVAVDLATRLDRENAPPADAGSLVGREFVRKPGRCKVARERVMGGVEYVEWDGPDGARDGYEKARFLRDFEPATADESRLRDEAVAAAELRRVIAARDHAMEQRLGAALGFPRYADDPRTFPGATPSDGACVGPYTIADLADMAADRIERLGSEAAAVLADMDKAASEMVDQGMYQPWRERLRAALAAGGEG